MSSPTSSQGTAGGAPSSPHQDRLISFCRQQGVRSPNFQIVSDRRGGRTAWSCVVTVQGTPISARFWYDGQYVNNAREDAAERALQMLGVLPAPPSQPPIHLRQGSQQYYGMINS
ncbi:hypothetical protein CB0940_04192 [Cercospora beticola]|uniref:DRBM domain-containing protein n=2 Tax=Cercospora TaxID=29002 RepID=A0A2S6CD12_9PEZI|nr:hypothetical protein CB0940_04192 [Cercospora beticola]PIA93096.1 hypothetical protein CB0940_04192 [Cercospora beticola]PPJ57608.1 hypothetical protein CBER1_04797 [Cercospora berteroae]WPB01410.1 hypothetical protein RHO25_006036 [Cercospora beticola]CAK1363806.1 unnamed protein product [Cercospora beticola]